MSLLTVWIGYAAVGVVFYSLVFYWAVRNRQFSDQDRARYLALNAESFPDAAHEPERDPSRLDRFFWIVLLALTAIIMVCAIWLGWRKG